MQNAVGKYKAPFRRSDQQDSHEFLTILVDWLHEEMNEVYFPPNSIIYYIMLVLHSIMILLIIY